MQKWMLKKRIYSCIAENTGEKKIPCVFERAGERERERSSRAYCKWNTFLQSQWIIRWGEKNAGKNNNKNGINNKILRLQHTQINLPAIVILSTHSFNPPTLCADTWAGERSARAHAINSQCFLSGSVRFASIAKPYTRRTYKTYQGIRERCWIWMHTPSVCCICTTLYLLDHIFSNSSVSNAESRARIFILFSFFFHVVFFRVCEFFVTVCDRSSFIRPLTIRFPL